MTNPMPIKTNSPFVRELLYKNYEIPDSVKKGLADRIEVGIKSYGTSLQVHNGRDAGQDLIEELLDAIMYAEQCRAQTSRLYFRKLVPKLIELAGECIREHHGMSLSEASE